jgi:hypothetical protein
MDQGVVQKYEPPAKIMNIESKEAATISDIWFEYCNNDMWSHITQCSEKYANKDWVREVGDGDNSYPNKKRLFGCISQCRGARYRQSGS